MDWKSALKELQADWGLPDDRLASFLHVQVSRLREWRETEEGADAPIPEGGEGIGPLLMIHRRLREGLRDPLLQLKWLMEAHPLLDGLRPADAIASSPGGASWVAYLLESGQLEDARAADKAKT